MDGGDTTKKENNKCNDLEYVPGPEHQSVDQDLSQGQGLDDQDTNCADSYIEQPDQKCDEPDIRNEKICTMNEGKV